MASREARREPGLDVWDPSLVPFVRICLTLAAANILLTLKQRPAR
jgi:hypothetical protein